MTLACSMCKRDLPPESFHLHRKAKRGRQAKCKECSKIREREYYKLKTEHIRARQKKFRDERRAYINAEKAQPCMDCAKTYPSYVMQFDHVRGTKAFHISERGPYVALERLIEEIAKCEIVCANCHMIRTHG